MILVTNEPFGDGEHILYVNGAYRDESDIGRLMHDFSCCDPDDMNFDVIKDASKYYKENEEGVAIMCRAFEETRKEGIAIGLERGLAQGLEQGREQGLAQGEEKAMLNMLGIIKNLMKSQNLTARQAMDMLGLPPAEQAKYMEKLN